VFLVNSRPFLFSEVDPRRVKARSRRPTILIANLRINFAEFLKLQ
jgi:hypothetical protein